MKRKMDKLVSIIIPVYNSEATLRRCIDSALSQTYKNTEIIIVDDASYDSSAYICNEYVIKKYNNLRVVHKEKNEGLLLARKTGVFTSSGDYILNLDSDDYIESCMIENLIEDDKKKYSDIITSGYYLEYADGSLLHRKDGLKEGYYDLSKDQKFYNSFIYNGSFLNNGILPAVWCKLIKRDLLMSIYDGIDLRLNMQEDALATYGSIGMATSVRITEKIYYHYCIDNESMSRRTNENYYIDINNVYKVLKKVFEKNRYRNCLRKQLDLYMMYWSYAGICEYFGLEEQIVPPYFTFDTDVIAKGSKVILYGAGRVGKSFYKVCNAKGIELVLWIDRNAEAYKEREYDIDSIEKIKDVDYDFILIAMKSDKSAEEIKRQLILDYEVSITKIICPEVIFELDKFVDWEL